MKEIDKKNQRVREEKVSAMAHTHGGSSALAEKAEAAEGIEGSLER